TLKKKDYINFSNHNTPYLQSEKNEWTKRREKNRDAARKSRRKQTERADELHESLEHSNSALHKEIAALKKELHLLTTSLERHEPYCRLPSKGTYLTDDVDVRMM
uniref:Basic leucine zipper ATF-like transcription factor 2 n=1 Tax=Haplochromis burtoni TaxID=8153 RepID=A0A3Q2X7J3_HAPBU